MSDRASVLIVCTGNSARSQIAEGLLRHDGGDRFIVASAGVAPSFVRPEAIEVMREIGIDISAQRSKSIDEFAGRAFDYVITVCDNAKQTCPVFPAAQLLHWNMNDPAAVGGDRESKLQAFRDTRAELRKRLREFVEKTNQT
ncbi:MAG TPA: arsenate reductase ArsC [Pyrinomonadaceae bacterium]|nr:arsenate reductase ArsC [Pyrinomonadaceae bacterium]